MHISLFFDGYKPFHEYKDPGQIALGLLDKKINVNFITLDKPELNNYSALFPIIKVKDKEELYNKEFWEKIDSDFIIIYSWISLSYTSLIEIIKSSGKKVLIKADSDGKIGYPLLANNLKYSIFSIFFVKKILRQFEWRIPFKLLYQKKIKQIELSDGVMIESPDALLNLNYFLTKWRRKNLIKKIYCVPNPVTSDIIKSELKEKENIVVCVGRWEDEHQKNTKLMIKALIEFLKYRNDYRAIIIGSGENIIKKLIKNESEDIKNRLQITGQIDHDEIKNYLLISKIFFMPSRWESFGIAAAEAACCGCSIVGTPLESLRYLTMQGFSGSIASSFKREAILAALIGDSVKWDRNQYISEKIANFWKNKLDRDVIAEQILNIIEKLK